MLALQSVQALAVPVPAVPEKPAEPASLLALAQVRPRAVGCGAVGACPSAFWLSSMRW